MSLSRHRADIETELITELQLLHPTLVIFGENADIDPPENAAWIRMSITIIDIIYPCINSAKEETDALFNVQVFTPVGQGAGEASTLVDEAKVILKASTLTGIEFLSFDISTGAIEGGWYGLLLRARYRAQD